VAGFWKAPRALVRLLAERKLNPNAYVLLNFVAQSGADRPGGYATTIGVLARSLELNEKTVRRSLRTLRTRGLLAYDDHPGSAIFTVRTSEALAALCLETAEPRTPLGQRSDTARTPTSDTTSDTTSDSVASGEERESASIEAGRADSTSDTTSDTPRARARRRRRRLNPL
jgi:hypothetical protein